MGYRDRVIHLAFPDLSEDQEKDPIWVKIRNPRLLPPAELSSFASGDTGYEPAEPGEDGTPQAKVTDPTKATDTLRKMVARLVVAARCYDATDPGTFDPETGDPTGEQPRMPPPPWTPEQAGKLPFPVLERISKEFAEAVNPQRPLSGSTQKTSSSPQSPSTTEPGAEGQSQPN